MYRMLATFLAALMLGACSDGGPSVAEVRDQFQTDELPGILRLESFTIENSRNDGNEQRPVWLSRFVAKAALREDTWDIATVEADTRILRKVRGAGEAISIYGVVDSRRDGERWRHRFQTDASSRPVLGRPLSDYGPGALIEGSPEAEALLARVAQQTREREIAQEAERAAAAAAQKAAEAERTAQRKRIEEAVARHGAEFMPTTLSEYSSDRHSGRSFVFLAQDVSIAGNRKAFGTDTYGAGSDLAKAIVHAGLLKPGESGIVRVTMLGDQPRFAGSPRNGVDTASYDRRYMGIRIELLEKL